MWSAWGHSHSAPPATFHELVRYVDDYPKPFFVARHGNVPTDAASLDEVPINPIAKKLGVEWNTASNWLARYLETCGGGMGAPPRKTIAR